MAIRFDDASRTLTLSVLDLVEAAGLSGHLVLDVVQTARTRLAQGREVHRLLAADRAVEDADYRAEVTLKHQEAVGEWTVIVQGRVDGLTEVSGRVLVEEVKSTALDAGRLYRTRAEDWPRYAAQLEIYLWMLASAGHHEPVGRLVLVSLLDGARHVLGVPLHAERVGERVRRRLGALVEDRERRLAWLEARRGREVPLPFEGWRPGQEAIAERTAAAMDAGRRLLVEAPTGLGKTAAVLHGALRHALRHDRQVFWATSRTIQQVAVLGTLHRFVQRGLPLRVVAVNAKEKVCLNDVVACDPEHCRFARDYHDKVRDRDVVERVLREGADLDGLKAAGLRDEVCPHALALDVSERADVVVGDYNYAFDPAVRIRRHFGEEPDGWVVVADEAHGLVERARGYRSPRIEAAWAEDAVGRLDADDRMASFAALAREIGEAVHDARSQADGPERDGQAVATLSRRIWQDLADRVDEVGLDYALLTAERPLVAEGEDDPWQVLARAVLRFAAALEEAGEETVEIVDLLPGREAVGLLCLDPSPWLGPFLGGLGGFVAASATLSPDAFYRDLMGLDTERLETLSVPSPFPPENLRVLVAPRVSTLFRDRETHAPRTAALIEACARRVPGNTAVYFPSFAMLDDIASRWELDDRELLVQRPQMSEETRREWLDRLRDAERPVVLAAVLGGIFAEGIDLPAGALSCVVVAGPALPPVGLERDLLRAHYEHRYGEGFLYASLIPGTTRVVQAAGRLVRGPEDRGVVVLVGKRFRWRDHAALLPHWWDVEVPEDPVEAVGSFWEPT